MNSRAGMTLVEVLLAATLLGLGLVALLGGLTSCLAIMRASREYQQAQWALSLGELAYPLSAQAEKVEDLEVAPDYDLASGFVFERWVDERELLDDAPDDGLLVVRTRIAWGGGGEGRQEELVRYLWNKELRR